MRVTPLRFTTCDSPSAGTGFAAQARGLDRPRRCRAPGTPQAVCCPTGQVRLGVRPGGGSLQRGVRAVSPEVGLAIESQSWHIAISWRHIRTPRPPTAPPLSTRLSAGPRRASPARRACRRTASATCCRGEAPRSGGQMPSAARSGSPSCSGRAVSTRCARTPFPPGYSIFDPSLCSQFLHLSRAIRRRGTNGSGV